MSDFTIDSLQSIEQIAADLRAEALNKKPHDHSYVSPTFYRGQSRASYRLETTLERFGLVKFGFNDYVRYLSKVKPAIESLLERKFSFQWDGPEEKGHAFMLSQLKLREGQYEFMVYLRHHGFPTPLLDWSQSLYVAVYFALSEQPKDENSAVFMYIENLGHGKGGIVGSPEISTMGQYVTAHKRHWIQQSNYTACVAKQGEQWVYHPHEDALGGLSDESDRLVKVEIVPEARIPILRQLDSMNINAFSLFGTEEALMKTLAFRELLEDDL